MLRSAGHSAAGSAYHEFVSLTHVVEWMRVRSGSISAWREDGGTTRRLNPSAGRLQIRQIPASLPPGYPDRSNQGPGQKVERILPCPN